MISNREDNPRLLLAKIRKADYTHAGDEEAIDIFLEKLETLLAARPENTPPAIALDAGCGLGGTADYVRKKTALRIHGIDIDVKFIEHAKKNYPDINVAECDIMQVDTIFNPCHFDLIYLFNVFYALPDQQKGLEKLANVAKPGAILAIFDYTQTHPNSIELKDLAGKPMNPIYLHNLKIWLKQTGWELIEIINLSKKYDEWYSTILKNLEAEKNNLLNEFSDTAYQKVLSTFSLFSNKLKNKEMGGSLIYAKYRGMTNALRFP